MRRALTLLAVLPLLAACGARAPQQALPCQSTGALQIDRVSVSKKTGNVVLHLHGREAPADCNRAFERLMAAALGSDNVRCASVFVQQGGQNPVCLARNRKRDCFKYVALTAQSTVVVLNSLGPARGCP